MSWPALPTTSNKFKQTYIQGFVDISGGSLILRNSDASFNGNVNVGSTVNVTGNLILRNTGLYLKAEDYNHYVKYINTWTADGRYIDGPTIFGYEGGAIGTSGAAGSANIVMQWKYTKDCFFNGNISVNKQTAPRSGYSLDINGNAYIGSNLYTNGLTTMIAGLTATAAQTINFGTNAPTMSGANIGSGTIPVGALNGGSSNFVDLTSAQTVGGAKTFSSSMTLSSGLTATAAQTINFGTNAPTMSGANIATGTIPAAALTGTIADARLSSNVVLLTGSQTITGTKTFSSATNFPVDITGNTRVSGFQRFASSSANSGISFSDGTTCRSRIYNDFNLNMWSLANMYFKLGGTGTDTTITSPNTIIYLQGSTQSVAIKSESITAGYELDVSGNVYVRGNLTVINGITASAVQTINFGSNAPTMSGANIAAGTIPANAVSGGLPYVDLTTTQTVGGAKTFSSAMTLSNGLTASGTQTINFGSNAPTMSGANIAAGTIPANAVSGGLPYVDLTTTQTVGGAKTFSSAMTLSNGLTASGTQTINFGTNAPTMSGANITSIPAANLTGTIADARLSSNIPLLNGANTFTNQIIISSYAIDLFRCIKTEQPTKYVYINQFGDIGFWNGGYPNWIINSDGNFATAGGINASSAQTINFGSNAPTMSGANIAAGTIPANAVSGGLPYVDLTTTQTVGGAKTFSSAMTLSSGLTVSSGTVTLPSRSIADAALSTNIPLINGTNTFTGTVAFSNTTPTAPTPSTSDNSTTLATTAYVKSNLSSYLTTSSASSTYATQSSLSAYAPLASPALTGTPTAPTATTGTNSTQIATTAFVQNSLSGVNLTNLVDLTTNQTITGLKTFSSASNFPVDVAGNLRVSGFQRFTASSSSSGISFTSSNGTTCSSRIYNDSNLNIWSNENIYFKAGGTANENAGIANTAVLYIDGDNKSIAIGKESTTTGYALDVSGAILVNKGAYFSGTEAVLFYRNTASDVIHVQRYDDSSKYFFINSLGNIGFWNGSTVVWTILSTGVSTGLTQGSDRRLKENIEPMESQWSNILSINPVSFDWKESKRADIGFIAQDIYAKYPYLIPKYIEEKDPKSSVEEPLDLSGNPMYYGLDYGRMTSVLWKGLQETMQEIDSLKKENAVLKDLIHGLSERIASLETR